MDDLRRRFASLDHVPVPDLWDAIERRAAAAGSVDRVTGGVTRMSVRSGRSARSSLVLFLATIALLVALVAGALAMGSQRAVFPALLPAPPTSATVEAPTVSPQLGVVAYTQSGRIWVVNADGTDARQLVPDELDHEKLRYLDVPDRQYPLAWSSDGSRLYYRFERVEKAGPDDGVGTPHSGLAVTDAAGSKPVDLLDLVGRPGYSDDQWCPAAVEADNCQLDSDEMALSPDATRLAYAFTEGDDLNISTIVVLDVASGQITPLPATRTVNPATLPNEGPLETCTASHGGYNRVPQWSPDGTKLVFSRTDCQYAIFTINADGSDLRELVQVEWGPDVVPRWSSDGLRILFNSPIDWPVDALQAGRVDIATIRPDGTGLQVLTNDGVSVWPYWTRDGRIVFVRWTEPDGGAGDLWVMDGDGRNASQIPGTVPALTAVGCTVCPFPVAPNGYLAQDGRLSLRLWQPMPASQP